MLLSWALTIVSSLNIVQGLSAISQNLHSHPTGYRYGLFSHLVLMQRGYLEFPYESFAGLFLFTYQGHELWSLASEIPKAE
jgi:hypothetical protein